MANPPESGPIDRLGKRSCPSLCAPEARKQPGRSIPFFTTSSNQHTFQPYGESAGKWADRSAWKIAAFARQRPRVQIPLGPPFLPPFRGSEWRPHPASRPAPFGLWSRRRMLFTIFPPEVDGKKCPYGQSQTGLHIRPLDLRPSGFGLDAVCRPPLFHEVMWKSHSLF